MFQLSSLVMNTGHGKFFSISAAMQSNSPSGAGCRCSFDYGDKSQITHSGHFDTGIGMSPDEMDISSMNMRRPKQHDAPVRRNGFGLSISKKLIEGMGGSITVISQTGRGSKFSITLRA